MGFVILVIYAVLAVMCLGDGNRDGVRDGIGTRRRFGDGSSGLVSHAFSPSTTRSDKMVRIATETFPWNPHGMT